MGKESEEAARNISLAPRASAPAIRWRAGAHPAATNSAAAIQQAVAIQRDSPLPSSFGGQALFPGPAELAPDLVRLFVPLGYRLLEEGHCLARLPCAHQDV